MIIQENKDGIRVSDTIRVPLLEDAEIYEIEGRWRELTNEFTKMYLEKKDQRIAQMLLAKQDEEITRLDAQVKLEEDNRKHLIKQLKKKDKRIQELEEMTIIMEKYFELICDYGYDYDGFNKEEDLKKLIDELVRLASLGRVCNTTEVMYEDGKEKYWNILHKEVKRD